MATAPRAADYSEVYRTAFPFPHIVIDGHFPAEQMRAAAAELRALAAPAHQTVYAQAKKRALADKSLIPPAALGLIEQMNAPGFVSWLEWLTGIKGLVPDHGLFGGGVHQIERGGFLKIHTDFNWHRRLRLYRRVNVLLYLNEGWREEWGGHLELWRPDMSACGLRAAPLLNRMAIFSTTDESYHGHPEPLLCPEGVTRNSIALYYYSAEPASRFGKCELTNYRERPGERFASLKHRAHQLLIRSGLGRTVMRFRRRGWPSP